MPTYEYECRKCSHEFEQQQRITDHPLKRCPKCKGAIQRKIGTGAGLLFKGSGFYITDYRSEGYKKSAKADAPTSSPTPPSGTKDSSKGPVKKQAEQKTAAKTP